MKKLFFVASILAVNTMLAQKTEVSFQPQTGFFFYGGKTATKEAGFFFNDAGPSGLDGGPGKIPGISFCIEGAVKRISKKMWLYGIGLSFESLQNRIDIIRSYGMSGSYEVTGSAKQKYKYITTSSYFGKRVGTKKITLDVTIGIDVAFCQSNQEKGQFLGDIGDPYSYDWEMTKPPADIRPRVQLTVYYKKIGILLGYSQGLTDYYNNSVYADFPGIEAFSRFLRIGVSYRIK
jgi:hypothetical protein